MAKTVCIVGAGPSGLVAAKNLLHGACKGLFEVTIFDAQPRVGGLWPTRKDDGAGLMHPCMVANQSRHTMHFSDFSWPDDAPQIPRAWQIGQYLERYRDKYCAGATLHLGRRVERTELLSTTIDGGPGHSWRVRTRSEDGQEESEHTFDYLLVASGYFGRPAIPSQLQRAQHEVPVVHSSRYRDLESLLGSNAPKSGKILVVGGQMSGVEIAGTIATHLSTAKHSPGPSSIDGQSYTLHHLVQRPTWVMPLTMTPKPAAKAPPFLPLDFSPYNLANRPKPLMNTQGHISVEAARISNGIFKTVLGTDQSAFSLDVTVDDANFDDQPFLAVSDPYLGFVKSGDITLSYGKLASINGRTAKTETPAADISDVAAVILATGFDAASSVAYLPDEVKETLAIASEDLNNTVALAFHGTHHPKVPNLGFVGFYRSPYWGVMESQARFVAALWAAGGPESPSLRPAMASALSNDISLERTIGLRSDPRASQFPMSDYLWLMEEFARPLQVQRIPYKAAMPTLTPGGPEMDIIIPARYPNIDLTEEQAAEVERSMRSTLETAWSGFRSGGFVARAVFRSLLGEWKLERDLISRLPSHPSGHFSGTAKFLLRRGTKDGRDTEFERLEQDGDPGLEYLYIEDGEFRAENGMIFRATRRYIWRYNEQTDKLSVWFAKTDDQKKADYLFHQVEFKVPADQESSADAVWEADAGHLCIDDFYNVNYTFQFAAVNLTNWTLAYKVNGPQKDYTIKGQYSR
ncbi:hypothetical protein GQ53DRAFT_721683 [Thozetella sp. PMI_491]|nr:hypothetical protein GQ53DRAFT_721683 [Thozetella sp. PMI_491]